MHCTWTSYELLGQMLFPTLDQTVPPILPAPQTQKAPVHAGAFMQFVPMKGYTCAGTGFGASTFAPEFTCPEFTCFVSLPSVPGLRMSMPPLKKAPSSIEIRCAVTSPVSEPSL